MMLAAVEYDMHGGTPRRFFHADHQGSIIALSDPSGNKVALNANDPWGIPNVAPQARFGYTGQVWLPELGMYYYKARIYSPTLGRFLQTDPIGYEDQVNLYAYVRNDPMNLVDTEGKCAGPAGRICQIVAARMAPVVGKIANGIARYLPGTAQRAHLVQQRLQQANLATHPAGWNSLNSARQLPHSVQTAREGASVLTDSATRSFDKYAGLGQTVVGTRGQNGFRERISTGGQEIGKYVAHGTDKAMATDTAIIHYSRTGYHIVPAAPTKEFLSRPPTS